MPVKVDLSKKHVAHAQYVVSFVQDREIRLKQGLIEKSFGHLFGGNQSLQTNVPDGMSSTTPRLVLRSKHKTLTVSQVALTLSLQFDLAKNAVHQQVGVIRKNIDALEAALPSFLEESKLRETGLIVVVNYPDEHPIPELGEHLYNRFISFPPLGDIVTTQVALGFRLDEEHYISLSGSVYETHEGQALVPVILGHVVVDPADVPVVGHGLEIRVDVNDKPRFDSANVLGSRNISFMVEKSVTIIENELDKMIDIV
jgi:hypothetical protein